MATAEFLKTQSNDGSFKDLFEELQWRGLVALSTDEQELREALQKPIVYYCGFDPTAPSLHLGNLVQLLLMRRLQLAGHKPLALIGGSTGLVGDPRPTAERTLNTKETVAEWVEKLGAQAARFLSFEGENAARMVNNLDWTAPMSAIDFLRDIGKLLSKDAVSARLNSDAGISYTEFSYQILQGMDFLELNQRYDCVLQTGGSDQWGNLTAGTDLIHRVTGNSVHLMASPLITNSDGKKFGKSEGNAVWLDADMTSPYAFYQFWLNVEDADVTDRLKVFTFLSKTEIEELAEQVTAAPHQRAAQKRLAYEVTALVHTAQAAEGAIAASAALFGQGELTDLDANTLDAALRELPNVEAGEGTTIIELLVNTKLVETNSDARRAIEQGGVYLNNVKVESVAATLDNTIHGKYAVLRRGKKSLAGIFVK